MSVNFCSCSSVRKVACSLDRYPQVWPERITSGIVSGFALLFVLGEKKLVESNAHDACSSSSLS